MKVVAILPGYKCEKTLVKFVSELPKKYFDEIIFIDDFSPDKGFEVAKKIKGIKTFRTLRNLGYGGNLKMCLGTAMERGADVMIELHPDGEYRFDGIGPALKEVEKGAKMVLGNRFTENKNALENGMYWWKYPVVWLINKIDNISLGTDIPDLHQGFRVYTRELLEKVDYKNNSNNYIFSFQIITQAARAGLPIASVPVSTIYEGEKRGASFKASLIYTLGTFGVLLRKFGMPSNEQVTCPNCNLSYLVGRRGKICFCQLCETGFASKKPTSLKKSYGKNYWRWTGIRKVVFELFQKRRTLWIEKMITSGHVLEVGCGENLTKLSKKFKVMGIDPFVNKKNILKKDFLSWKTKERFGAVIFWESLEHTDTPQKYLEKATELLKQNGLVFVEYPRFNGLESRVFGKKWYHLDLPRHLSQLTDSGLEILGKRVGLKTVSVKSVWGLEYSVWGLVASIWGGGRKLEESLNFGKWVLVFPLLVLASVIELGLCLVKQSPIGLYVGKKV